MKLPPWQDRSDILWTEDDYVVDENGCWIWQRRYSIWGRKGEERMHAVIGSSKHYNAARQIMEDYIGESLPGDLWVVGACATNRGSFIKRCVNPEHHDLVGVKS